MAPPVKTIANVLVGFAQMYTSPVGTAAPADTVAFNESWSTTLPAWVHPGFSEKGLTLNMDRKEKKHMVEEIANPVVISVESSTLKIQFGFAEATLENLKLAAGGGTITTVAAATGIIGKKTLKISEDLEVIQIGFEGKNPQGFFRRVIVPRDVTTGKIKTEFDRAKNKQVFNAEFEAVCSIEDVIIYDKTANSV